MSELLLLLAGLLVLALFGAMVWLLWWALFADRANGRRRCPRCWFDMSYSPTTTCGECGFTPRHESQFYRTRRRLGVALLAIVGSLVIATAVYVHYDNRGWMSMVPARMLIIALPWVDDDNSSVYEELQRRMIFNQLTQSQWIAFLGRSVKGDGGARPTTDEWIAKYGSLIWRFRSRFAPDSRSPLASPDGGESSLEKKLLQIEPRLEVNTREVWPVDVTPRVNVVVYDWWPYGSQVRIIAHPQFEGAESYVFYRAGRRPTGTVFAMPLHGVPPDVEQCEVVFELARRRPGVVHTWQHMTRVTRTVSLKREGRLAKVIKPTADPELDDAMVRAFTVGMPVSKDQADSNVGQTTRMYVTRARSGNIVRWDGGGPSPVRFRYSPRPTMAAQFAGTAIGVSVQLYHEDQLARQLDMWWKAGTGGIDHRGWSVAYENIDLLSQVNEDDDGWTLRVKSDPRLALRAGDADAYWEGEFTVPIMVDEQSGPADEPRWWTPDLANAPSTAVPDDLDVPDELPARDD